MDKDKILQLLRKNKPPFQPLREDIFSEMDVKADLSATFCENLKSVGAEVYDNFDEEGVSQYIAENFPDAADFSLHETWKDYQSGNFKDYIEKLKTVVLAGQYGIAENAAIWLDETNFPYRIVPFIAQNLVIKLARKNLVYGMEEAYRKIDITKTGFGVFISGPSKTADIEQVLVFGAHGPLKHTVLLYD
jgi:L-lactate dehydrogenase complex protein LldG